MQEKRGHECLIAIATSTTSLSIRATQKYFTLPGSNPPHGNQTTAVETGRAYLDLTSNGGIASFPTPKTPKKFTSRHLAEAFGMDPWMEKVVHWISLRLSFSPDDSARTARWERDKRIYGRCFLIDAGGLATCAVERASEGGRFIWPAGSGAKTAWLLTHAPGDLPAALDVATHLRSNDSFEGASESGHGRDSKSRTYWFRQFRVCRPMRLPPIAE